MRRIGPLFDAGFSEGVKAGREACAQQMEQWERHWLAKADDAKGLSGQLSAAELAREYGLIAKMIRANEEAPHG